VTTDRTANTWAQIMRSVDNQMDARRVLSLSIIALDHLAEQLVTDAGISTEEVELRLASKWISQNWLNGASNGDNR